MPGYRWLDRISGSGRWWLGNELLTGSRMLFLTSLLDVPSNSGREETVRLAGRLNQPSETERSTLKLLGVN